MADCIFCKIAAGEIPSIKVYEDEATLAFMDINPIAEGHLLVIPKTHAATIDTCDDASLAAAMRTVRRVVPAVRKALGVDALNVLQNNGEAAGQSVHHVHFHLVPRRPGDDVPIKWVMKPGDQDAIQGLGQRIAAAVG